jgi:hypothetical protein
MPLSPAGWGKVGGDNEPPILLQTLALARPDVEWVLVGRNSGEDPAAVGLPSNVSNPWTELRPEGARIAKEMQERGKSWAADEHERLTYKLFDELDGIIVWAGQHGTSNTPIPEANNPDKLTKPQDSFVNYGAYLVRGLNRMPSHKPVVWLCPDVRNYLKARDIAKPPWPSVMSQYEWSKMEKHERYGDTLPPPAVMDGKWSRDGVWHVRHRYTYDRLETVGIPQLECNYDHTGRSHFGIVINEARAYVTHSRKAAMKFYVLPLEPAWVRGTWSAKSAEELGLQDVTPVPWWDQWSLLHQTLCTFTTPSSGSGWATTKPWEAFACGTVCFFHPRYDDQGHVIPTLEQVKYRDDDEATLVRWLRVEDPEQLKARVAHLARCPQDWSWIVGMQRRLYDQARVERRCERDICRRLGI